MFIVPPRHLCSHPSGDGRLSASESRRGDSSEGQRVAELRPRHPALRHADASTIDAATGGVSRPRSSSATRVRTPPPHLLTQKVRGYPRRSARRVWRVARQTTNTYISARPGAFAADQAVTVRAIASESRLQALRAPSRGFGPLDPPRTTLTPRRAKKWPIDARTIEHQEAT